MLNKTKEDIDKMSLAACIEDAQKVLWDLSVNLAIWADAAKIAWEMLSASRQEQVKVVGSKADLGEKPLKNGWEHLPPTQNQVSTICNFGVQPLQGMNREQAACLIAALIEHPPKDKRIIKR